MGKLSFVAKTVIQPKVFMKILLIPADIKSIKEILNLSGADLQRLMKLSSADVQCLLRTVSHALRRNSMLTGNAASANTSVRSKS